MTALAQNKSSHKNTMPKLSLKKNFVWAFAGNVTSAFCMSLLLILLTKLGTAEIVGVFAIAQAVGMPISTLLGLRLQMAQVTDARNKFGFADYYSLRVLTSCVSVVIIFIVSFTFYSWDTASVITALGIGYAALSLREIFLAVMQKAERMDRMAVSRMMQSFFSLVLFGGLFWIMRNIILSIAGLIVARLAVLYCYDIPVAKKLLVAENCEQKDSWKRMLPFWRKEKLWNLLKVASPLGLITWLTTLFMSMPRLILDRYAGRKEVGYFAAMSSLLVVANMFVATLGQVVMPRLAKYYANNKRAFIILLSKFTGIVLLIGISGVVVSFLFGRQILTFVFTSEYAEHSGVFVQLMAAGGIMLLFSCMNIGLTSARKFAVQIPVYIAAVVAAGISAFVFIPNYGMLGAVWSVLICSFTGFVGCLFLVLLETRESRGNSQLL